jgi:hypothetical protein
LETACFLEDIGVKIKPLLFINPDLKASSTADWYESTWENSTDPLAGECLSLSLADALSFDNPLTNQVWDR